FERGAIVAGAGDLQSCFGHVQSSESLDDDVDTLVLLESAEINEQRLFGSLTGVWSESIRVDSIVYHPDRLARNTACHQIVRGTNADCLEGNTAVKRAQRTLREPHRRGNGGRCLAKNRPSKEMVNEHDELVQTPQRRVQRHFVQVLDDHVVIVAGEMSTVVALSDERIGMTSPGAVNFDPAKVGPSWGVEPAAAKQINAVAAVDDTAENFL